MGEMVLLHLIIKVGSSLLHVYMKTGEIRLENHVNMSGQPQVPFALFTKAALLLG